MVSICRRPWVCRLYADIIRKIVEKKPPHTHTHLLTHSHTHPMYLPSVWGLNGSSEFGCGPAATPPTWQEAFVWNFNSIEFLFVWHVNNLKSGSRTSCSGIFASCAATTGLEMSKTNIIGIPNLQNLARLLPPTCVSASSSPSIPGTSLFWFMSITFNDRRAARSCPGSYFQMNFGPLCF